MAILRYICFKTLIQIKTINVLNVIPILNKIYITTAIFSGKIETA